MKNKNKKQALALNILKGFFVLGCLSGFLFQTFEFLLLYWTYPTVVDIQQIDPSYLDVPAFTICNMIGYNFTSLCRDFDVSPCLPTALIRYSGTKFCRRFPEACFNGSLPKDFQVITYTKFMQELELTPEDHEKLRVKLEDYMECTIEFAGEYTPCDLTNVLGPMYTKEDMPQYCYAIYSLWSQPNKTRQQIAKGSVMHFKFELNTTIRPDDPDSSVVRKPKYNIPGNPSVQIAVHSPYFLPSPFLDGMGFIGGRAYELRLKMDERHLLPPPYQTNCTDYMKTWAARGGRAPIDQMSAVQECRVNKTYEAYGCLPVSLDYPHNYKLCKSCPPNTPCNISTFAEECGKLAENYTQPCDAITYTADKEDRVITTFDNIDSAMLGIKEIVRKKILAHDCDSNLAWTKECGTIDVYILFDRFEITNLTYIPKFESLELFSVIGGYMGMWLGISLLTVYDFIGSIIVMIKTYFKKKREKTKIHKLRREAFHRGYEDAPKLRNDYNRGYEDTPKLRNDYNRGYEDTPKLRNENYKGYEHAPKFRNEYYRDPRMAEYY